MTDPFGGMNEFRILVCGGRDYDDRERLFRVLDKALEAKELDKT